MQRHRRLSLAAVFCTFFIDNLCWSIVFPIFAPYFLDPTNCIFGPEVGETTRTAILGLFLMAFPLGQFFGAPFLGEYADRSGRKRALIVSIVFTCVGLAMSAWGMRENWLWLLFVGRLITGVFASNLSLCLAAVTDLSPDEKTKARYFGYLSVVAGLSFILGAFFGGKLSDPTVYRTFEPSSPLWFATLLSLGNLAFVWYGFRETTHVDTSVRFDILEGFRNIGRALQTRKIKRIYLVFFLFLFAWTILFQFMPVLVVQEFQFTASGIGDLSVYMGLCWIVGSGYLNRILIHRFSPLRVLEACLLLFALFCAGIALVHAFIPTIAFFGACAIAGSLAWPLCNSTISNLAPANIQGKILGISQSMQSLAMALAPVAGALIFRISLDAVFLLAAAVCLSAATLYFFLKVR